MKEMNLKEVQQVSLELLKEVHDFCVEKNIKYTLFAGTLIGAIRHHGFIPWDDDLDVLMDRPTYLRFMEIARKSNNFGICTDTYESLWIPRVRAVSAVEVRQSEYVPTIDIFIIDHVPDSRFYSMVKKMLVLFLQGMIKRRLSLKKGNIGLKMVSMISFIMGKLVPLSVKFRLYNYICSISNRKETQKCSCYNVEYKYVGREYPAKLLSELKKVEFENRVVSISAHYDEYLKTLYGDYLTLPKESDRYPKHKFLKF